jgi:hypothetical protein
MSAPYNSEKTRNTKKGRVLDFDTVPAGTVAFNFCGTQGETKPQASILQVVMVLYDALGILGRCKVVIFWIMGSF